MISVKNRLILCVVLFYTIIILIFGLFKGWFNSGIMGISILTNLNVLKHSII